MYGILFYIILEYINIDLAGHRRFTRSWQRPSCSPKLIKWNYYLSLQLPSP